jgi:hypothetical protein
MNRGHQEPVIVPQLCSDSATLVDNEGFNRTACIHNAQTRAARSVAHDVLIISHETFYVPTSKSVVIFDGRKEEGIPFFSRDQRPSFFKDARSIPAGTIHS